jgi:hypothetical protein
MRLEYNQRNFLRLVPTPLLGEYFQQRDLLSDFDWAQAPGDIEILNNAIVALPGHERQAVTVDFQNADLLASRNGILTILDVGRSRGSDLLPVMGKARTNIEKVFRVLLAKPEIFRIASQFAWADNLKRYWHRRSDLPAVPADTGAAAIEGLTTAISEYYVKNQGRGEFCNIEVEDRGDARYFMVYLADYPKAVVCFEDSNELKRSFQQQAFDVVFIHYEKDGRLELYADGGCQMQKELAQMFARHILRKEIELDAQTTPTFRLEQLKDAAFRFCIEPADGIKAIRMRSMRLAVPDGEGGNLTFTVDGRRKEANLHVLVARGLNREELALECLKVDSVTLQAVMTTGNPRPKTVTFTMSARNSSNLKDTPDHRRIRAVLERSKVICA